MAGVRRISYFFIPAGTMVILTGILLTLPFFYTKTDDSSELLNSYLERGRYSNSSGSVLGVSTENDTSKLLSCPDEKPIIGWLDFEGNMVIRDRLPLGQTPTVCFSTVQEANEAGFLEQ